MNLMKCREFEEIVQPLVRLELLDVNLRETALEHAWSCPCCAARMAELQAIFDASEALAASVQGEGAPERVEVALLAAFRQERQRRTVWRQTWEWAGLTVAAAGLVVAAWVSYGRWRAEISPASNPEVAFNASGTASGDTRTALAPDSPSATPSADAANHEADALADFVPVPYGESMEPGDAGMVVRVELTRAALGLLGYPVDQAKATQVVQADVLVGEDGWPRAVRVLQ